MKPVRHKGSNFVYNGPTSGIGDLWVQKVKQHDVRVVYEFDDEDRKLIAEGGRVELAMYCEPIPPISMIVLHKDMCKPIAEHGWDIPLELQERASYDG